MQAYIGPTNYPHLREMLDPSVSELSDSDIEALFESAFGEGVTPAEYEEFFGSLGKAVTNFARQAAPIASTAISGAVRGASSGAALGPWGMLGGALAGGTGAALQKHGPAGARGIGGAISSVVGTAGRLSGPGGLTSNLLGMGAQALGSRSPAAAQLLGALGHPATRQAVSALVRGRNPNIPAGVAGLPVPASAFAGLLASLAREAEAEAEPWAESPSAAYLADASGEFVVDPRDDTERAGRVLQLINETAFEAWDEDESADESDEWDDAESSDELYEFDEYEEAEELAWAAA
jgi:hypothetical protein